MDKQTVLNIFNRLFNSFPGKKYNEYATNSLHKKYIK